MNTADTIIKIENISKQYRLGIVGTATIKDDFQRWLAKLRGKEDPFLKIGDENNRFSTSTSEYVWALKDINLSVKRGEVLGIIGKNGAGKSTLLKLLSKVTEPTTGSIKVKGRIASLLEVGTGFHPELTGRENIFLNGAILGMKKQEIKSKFDEIIDFSGIGRYLDTPVKRYSSGMYVRLAFAVAAHLEPEILIVDEVLAVGDADFQKKAIGKMQAVSSSEGRTVIFVSHNMAAINNLCTSAVLMENGTVKMTGKTEDVIRYYLKGEFDKEAFGVIPDNYPRNQYNKGILQIHSINLFNFNNEELSNFRMHERVKAKVVIHSKEDIYGASIIFSFMDETVGRITYSSSRDKFNGNNDNEIKKGANVFEIEIDQDLLPSNYSVGISVLDKAGYPFDGILNFGNVKIENFGLEKEIYPWVRPIGLVNTRSLYKKIK